MINPCRSGCKKLCGREFVTLGCTLKLGVVKGYSTCRLDILFLTVCCSTQVIAENLDNINDVTRKIDNIDELKKIIEKLEGVPSRLKRLDLVKDCLEEIQQKLGGAVLAKERRRVLDPPPPLLRGLSLPSYILKIC